MPTNILMPEMGEGVIEGTIVRWLKKEGERVRRDDPVLEVETDKVTVEIPAEDEGILLKINADEGETVSVGTVLAVIGQEGEAVESAPAQQPAMQPQPAMSAPAADKPSSNHVHAVAPVEKAATRSMDGVRVSPVVARMLQVHDIDINELTGTGRDGRITKKDVLAYLDEVEEEAQTAAPRTPAPMKAEPVHTLMDEGDEIMALSGMRRSIAEHMVRSKHTSPHVTTVFEFDFTAVAKHRAANKESFARDGVNLTYMPYLALATVQALKKHRIVNASWSDDGVVLKKSINLGIAVAVTQGLIVPVIRGADALNLLGMARTINDFAERARKNQLKPDEIKGGTFTISNHGASGSLIGTPIINQPQVGILGVGMIEKRVKVIGEGITIRPCAYVSFSFDHRILDGASADAFIMDIKTMIENFSG